MKRKMIRFARAGNCGGRGASESPCCASASRPDSAIEPKPAPHCRSISRRVIIASVHKQKLVRGHQGMNDVRPRDGRRRALFRKSVQMILYRPDLLAGGLPREQPSPDPADPILVALVNLEEALRHRLRLLPYERV